MLGASVYILWYLRAVIVDTTHIGIFKTTFKWHLKYTSPDVGVGVPQVVVAGGGYVAVGYNIFDAHVRS